MSRTTTNEPPLGLFEEAEKDDIVEEDEEDDDEGEGGTGEVAEVSEGGDGGACEEEEEEDCDMRTEVEKSADEKSSVGSSEKEGSPACPEVTKQLSGGCGAKGEGSPVRVGEKRRRGRETDKEYEIRRLARRESLKFVLDFCKFVPRSKLR